MPKLTILPDMEEEFVKRWNAGEATSFMAEYYKCHTATITGTARRLGLSRRSYGIPPNRLQDRAVQGVLQMWDEGLSVHAISVQLGCWRGTIVRHLIENGRVVQQYAKGMRGPESPAWRGGRTLHYGYWYIYLDEDDPMFCMAGKNKHASEHRVLMARKIGRPLLKSETVHHINGDPMDNRLENLQLRSGRHGRGVVHECLDCGSNNIKSVPIADPEEQC